MLEVSDFFREGLLPKLNNKKDKRDIRDLLDFLRERAKDLYSITRELKDEELIKSEMFYKTINDLLLAYSLLATIANDRKEAVVFWKYPGSMFWYLFGAVSEDLKEELLETIENYNEKKTQKASN